MSRIQPGLTDVYPGGDFPGLNRQANAVVRVEVGTSSSPGGADLGHVELRVQDSTSGETLVRVQIDPAHMWRLVAGGSQSWPAFVSPNLDRVGKRMENERVNLPAPLDGDTEKDVRRDVGHAVVKQLPEDWHYAWDAYDTPRVDNKRQRYTIVRRWVPVEVTA